MTPLLLALALRRSGDLALTIDLSARGGGHELNVLGLQSPVAQTWVLNKNRTRHPRLVTAIAWAFVAGEAAAVVHNARQVR